MSTTSSSLIRPERQSDCAAIRDVLERAFPTHAEADLVDALRADDDLLVSLVAVIDDRIVGHIAFSPVSIECDGLLSATPTCGFGLAPVAVDPPHQRKGVGARLIEQGLEACRDRGVGFVVVLGEPAYYGRFGFTPASAFGLQSQYSAGDAFMAMPLQTGAMTGVTGCVRYAPAFARF